MRTIKTGYAYLFYFLYRNLNTKGNFWVQFKAIALVTLLDIFFLISIFNYMVIFDKKIIYVFIDYIGTIEVLAAIFFILFQLWFFEKEGKWKRYISMFEHWPEGKRKKWDWVMRGIVFFILGNLVLSYYMIF